MSKKYKRQVRKVVSAGAEPRSAVTTSSSTTSRSQSAGPAAFNPDYSYVIKDLRRIGVLVGTFITILVILSFFLR
jgi:hypothetical protein